MREFDFRGPELLVREPGAAAVAGATAVASAADALAGSGAGAAVVGAVLLPEGEPSDRLNLGGGFSARAWPAGTSAPPGCAWTPLRVLLGAMSREESRAALKALALLGWRSTARFCGRCGAPLAEMGAAEREAEGHDPEAHARRCPACGLNVFPRISPAVIVLVTREGKALLARNARFPGRRFGLIAGFVDAGESLEEAARRELREEAGIEVGEFAYRGSQPWPFPDSLMLAFTAPWVSGEPRPDGREIVELGFFGPGELPEIPPPGSVARRLIDEFLATAMPTAQPSPDPPSGPKDQAR